ncbi:hypothetical protein U3A58_13825 [Algoriphagus sp. C2-6-M1]|nr:hypothetical protein [Algoriphagus sp. C2-6-M1]MEB2781475.1 hypothetical protein [Algoriphagus sp. C2-6-M1]
MLEQKEEVEEELLRQVAEILKVPAEAIKNFDEEKAINIISNSFENCNQPASIFYNSSINPVDQIIKIHEEKITLYERMLKEKDEMMARLEKLLNK